MGVDTVIGLIEPLSNLTKRALRSWRLWRYRRKSRKPPVPEERTKAIAHATVGGQIDKAISYRNFESKNIYVAVAYKSGEDRHASRVAILEQIGESFRTIWQDRLSIFELGLEVEDIDRDGMKEVIIKSYSGGSGAHAIFLIVYSHRQNLAYTVIEHTERQNLARPIIPDIKIQPEPPAGFKSALETCAVKRGFFRISPDIDWDDAKNAIPRWHRDNGPNPEGNISAVFYDASMNNALFSASIGATLDDGKIIWTSYFKNPLIGRIKNSSEWFIAYSPSNFYEWACSMAHDGRRLWFAVHSKDAIYSFEFSSMQLYRHSEINGMKLKGDSELSYVDGRLHVGDSSSFAQDDLEEAIRGRIANLSPNNGRGTDPA